MTPKSSNEKYLSGGALFGDDFSGEDLKEWVDYENEAYANIGSDPGEKVYQYHSVNWLQGYKFLPKGKKYPRVLGIGSAYGHEFFHVANQIGELYILEPSDQLIANNVFNVPFTYQKPNYDGTIDFPSDHFDLIICFGVLHHIANVSFVMSEMARLLKPNGYLLIREPIISMGDWTKERTGLTKNERGIPLKIFREIIGKQQLTVIKENLFFTTTFFLDRLFRKTLKNPIYTYSLYLQIDRFLSTIFSWNQRYHAQNMLQRIGPTNVFYVLKK